MQFAPNKYDYPYKFEKPDLDTGKYYGVPAEEIAKKLSSVADQIIEIGGPTENGYLYLEGVSFRSQPLITNVSNNPLPFAKNSKELASEVDAIVDGRDTPFDDESLGLVMMGCMSRADDAGGPPTTEEETVNNHDMYERADMELEQFINGEISIENVKDAQLLQIYNEIQRVLKDGGYFLSNGTSQEMCALERFRLEIQSWHQASPGNDYYDFVAQKSSSQ